MRTGIFPPIHISALLLVVVLCLAGASAGDSETSQGPTLAAAETSKDASSVKSSTFDPIGKSFGDFVLESQRAYAAGDYDRVILLMNWVLAHGIDTNKAAV